MFYFMLRTKKIIKNEIDFNLYLLCQSHLKSFILCGFNMIAYLHDVGITGYINVSLAAYQHITKITFEHIENSYFKLK